MSLEKLTSAQIAWRAAQDIADGSYVNLGIGFPEMIAKFQPKGRHITYHTENGVLGFGDAPISGQEDWDLINAGKKAVSLKPGAAFFNHADSFAMVRGGHLDLAVLVQDDPVRVARRVADVQVDRADVGEDHLLVVAGRQDLNLDSGWTVGSGRSVKRVLVPKAGDPRRTGEHLGARLRRV